MSQQVDKAHVRQYKENVTILQQQLGSNLRSCVMEEPMTGDRAFFDQIDAVELEELTTRHQDTPLRDTPHSRRMVTSKPFARGDMVDEEDKVRSLNDPTNAYVRNLAMAANRKIDRVIIDAFNATASTGKDGTGTAAFDTSGYQIVHGGTSLTTAKCREARKILEAAENPEDGGDNKWCIVADAAGREGLLTDTDFKDADFNSVRALVDGSVNTWLGFEFVKSELVKTSGSTTSLYAWRKASMTLGVSQNPTAKIDQRADKNYGWQVYYKLDIGATRMDEKGVVEIQIQ
jgi:hypothetical protein